MDHDAAIRKAVLKLGYDYILCWFHSTKELTQKLELKGLEKEEVTEAYMLLKHMERSRSMEELKQNWSLLEDWTEASYPGSVRYDLLESLEK